MPRVRWGLLAERQDSVAAEALLRIGGSLLDEENASDAIGIYSQLLERFPDDSLRVAAGQLGLAKGLERVGEVEKSSRNSTRK